MKTNMAQQTFKLSLLAALVASGLAYTLRPCFNESGCCAKRHRFSQLWHWRNQWHVLWTQKICCAMGKMTAYWLECNLYPKFSLLRPRACASLAAVSAKLSRRANIRTCIAHIAQILAQIHAIQQSLGLRQSSLHLVFVFRVNQFHILQFSRIGFFIRPFADKLCCVSQKKKSLNQIN